MFKEVQTENYHQWSEGETEPDPEHESDNPED